VPVESTSSTVAAGLTVKDMAKRYRVSKDKVRAWIARGELAAVNTATLKCGKPRWVISPDALADFERQRKGGRKVGQPVKPAPRRKRKAGRNRPAHFLLSDAAPGKMKV
jgi:excisionase family DNA binding protein